MLNFLIGFANLLMVLTSLFLICLVLIQRGKGGGLAGAFGGVGGSSAFGTKAGDVFTRVTIIVAGFWFLLALFLVYTSNPGTRNAFAAGETEAAADSTAGGREAGSSAKDKGASSAVPPPLPTAEKATPPVDGVPPVKPATTPAVPGNPADAGMKPTSDLPPVIIDEPAPVSKPKS